MWYSTARIYWLRDKLAFVTCFYLAKKSESPLAKLEFSWGTKKVQKLHHRVHSMSLPRHGGQRHDTKTSNNPAFIWHAKCPKKKQLLILRNLKSRRFKKQFLRFGCISVCLGMFALFGISGTPRLFGSTKMSNGQPLAVAASSRLAKGAWCVELRCCAYKRNTFWDGNQTVRNEMLLTVLKINLKISSKN